MISRIIIILLGFGFQLNSQSIIEDIEKSLVKDSIIFGEIELGFERNIEVKSGCERYYVFNIKFKLENSLVIYTSRKYYIFDREKEQIHKLEIEKWVENFYKYKFAKFYDSKLILVYGEIMQTNYYLDEFTISGSKISSRKGICPALQKCKCYNLESDHKNHRILIRDFINVEDEINNRIRTGSGYIKPIAEYKIEAETMIFYY